MNINNKRKNDNTNSEVPTKRTKEGASGKKLNNKGPPGPQGKFQKDGNKSGGAAGLWKTQKPTSDGPGGKKKIQKKKFQPNKDKKQQLTAIVTEAKANYQLYTDKKVEKDEKQLLMTNTYKLVKDFIPELARMKGMGKIIASLIDKKNQKQVQHVLQCYDSAEAKLLLMKGNGYRLAAKLIQVGSTKTANQFIEASLTNGRGLRGLMANSKSAKVLNSAYLHGNTEAKRGILNKLVLGNMPLSKDNVPLHEIFSSCKQDVVESCKIFLQSMLDEKSINYEVIQDILALCMQTHKSTSMDVEEFVKLASEHIVALCRRTTNCTLSLWTIWLATAQIRKHIMKSLKGKVVSLLQTFNGRMFLIGLFESTDDTKAMSKIVLKELLDSLDDLVMNTDARKILEFLLLPRSTKFMHPKDIELLRQGDSIRTSKKSDTARFEEIQEFMQESFLTSLKKNCKQWLQDNKLCLFLVAIIDRFGVTFESDILAKLASTMASPEFSDRIVGKAVRMVLDSLINADVARYEDKGEGSPLFLNEFIPLVQKSQLADLAKCASQVSLMIEKTVTLKAALSFKPKKSWLFDKTIQDSISEWKNRQKTQSKKK